MARYLGGLTTTDESLVLPSDNYEDTSGNAIFTSDEQYLLNKSNLWPTPGNVNPSDRGIFMAGTYTTGSYPNADRMDFVSISSTGNATNFGDYSNFARYIATASSTTRGIGAGGQLQASSDLNVISYVTIASEGNASDFGDLQRAKQRLGGGGSQLFF